MILDPIADPAEVHQVAHSIVTTIDQPFAMADHEVHVPASIGISLFPNDGVTADELLRTADNALYQVKAYGKNHYRQHR